MIAIDTTKKLQAHARSACSWLVAACALFTFSLGHAAVGVDQGPLTVRSSLEPNIVLLLDDSASMPYNVMPDTPSNTGRDTGLISSSINGVYYNPAVTYDPPFRADGVSRYPNADFTNAPADGFGTSSTATRHIGTYNTGSGTKVTAVETDLSGGPAYTHTFTVSVAPQYDYADVTGCPSGLSGPNSSGQCTGTAVISENPRCQGWDSYRDTNNDCSIRVGNLNRFPDPCGSTTVRYGSNNPPGTPNSPGLELKDYNPGDDLCEGTGSVTSEPSCPAGYSINPNTAGTASVNCRRVVAAGSTKFRSLFVYAIKDGNTYTRHYVGAASPDSNAGTLASPRAGTCAEITGNDVSVDETGEAFAGGFPAARCHDNAAVRLNVANWFSYYRTRLLLAKTGLMNAFADLDPTIRFGFGSINGYTNTNGSGSNMPSDKTTTNSGTRTPPIARVKPFGNGNTGTRKAEFWTWLDGAVAPTTATPLVSALKAAGEYYRAEAQPWRTDVNDANSGELSCRQAYTILTTDGFWNNNTVSDVGNADNTSVTNTGPNNLSYTYTPAVPYRDGGNSNQHSNTLADVAMKYWVTDLRPSTPNQVPTNSADPAFWQHMVTFTIGLFDQEAHMPGVTPTTATPEQIFEWALGGGAPNNFKWPNPASEVNCSGTGCDGALSDLVHAAVNGHGGYYSAGNPDQFVNGLKSALRRVQERVGTGASLAANSTRLDTGTTTYQSLYYSGAWNGDLVAFPVNSSTGAIGATPSWTASKQAVLQDDWNTRNLKTCNPCGSGVTMIALDSANLSANQQTDLTLTLGTEVSSAQDVVGWLRGDPSKEQGSPGGILRRRTAVNGDRQLLGDVVNSQPVFVGPPNPNLFSGKTVPGDYATFAGNNASREARIWVAANDGMLHAFSASTGAETFAYLPGAVIRSGVKNLANPVYGSGGVPHQFYNDGELTVADAYVNGGWKTVLVGTTGRGPAKAVYALDVTNPSSPTLLWERSAGDGLSNDNWIGQIVGKPVIARTANDPTGTWSVIMGNGYNSGANKAALLKFDLGSGALTRLETDSAIDNGLAQPVAWIEDTNVSAMLSTIAYAGDLNGKLWDCNLPAGTCTHRFTTQSNQPITSGMLAGKDPNTGKVWVFFGTGRYLTQTDLQSTNLQTWYGLIVQGAGAVSPTTTVADPPLTQRSITAEIPATSTSLGARVTEEAIAGDMSGKSGWFMNLAYQTNRGERIVTPNQFQGSLLLGTTRIPGQGSDPCNPSGDGWIMVIDPFTGSRPRSTFFDRNNDGVFDAADKLQGEVVTGAGFTSIPNNPIFVGNTMLTSFDNATTSSIKTAGSVGQPSRQSWRELVAP